MEQNKRIPANQNIEQRDQLMRVDSAMSFPDIEDKIKGFVTKLSHMDIANLKSEELDSLESSNTIPQNILRRITLDELIKKQQDEEDQLIFTVMNQVETGVGSKDVQLKDLLAKETQCLVLMKDIDDLILLAICQDVTFTLLSLKKQTNSPSQTNVPPPPPQKLQLIGQVKLQFQVEYQEQSHSDKMTSQEISYFYSKQNSLQPQVCFLLGGNLGEIFVLKDIGSSFNVTRTQVCTSQIEQITSIQPNSVFPHQNLCLVLSQIEHIYLLNFAKGIIIAQFGNQGSSGPGNYLSVSWHPSYQYFLSSRKNGGIELWKMDTQVIQHIQEAQNTYKHPGKFFRKYVDMAFYYNWGIHPNQGGPLVFAALLEHILITVDDAMILRLTLMDIKNSESHLNILTLDTRLSPNEVKNVFIQDLEIVFVTKTKIVALSLTEEKPYLSARKMAIRPDGLEFMRFTSDLASVVGFKEKSVYLYSVPA